MIKHVLKTLVAVLAIAATAAGPVRGQNASPDVTLDFTTNRWVIPTWGNNYGPESYSNGTYSITLSATTSYRLNSGYLLLGKNGSYLELPEFESAVDSIVVVGNSAASGSVKQNIYVGETAVSTQTTGAKGTNTYVINENYRAAGNIYTLKVENAYNTQITYIKVYYVSSGGGSTPEPTQTTYTVAGNNSAMFGSAWNPSYTANDMTMNGDGTYSITYTNVYLDEDVQYKVVKNHSWDEAYPDLDRVINIAEAGTYTVTIHFNPTTHEVYEAMPTYTVRLAEGTEDAANWSIASGNASVPGTQVLENVMSGSQVTATYNGTTKKVKSVKAVKYVPPVLVSSIVLDKQTAYLAKDSTLTLTASVLPENAADKSYTWSSDNTSVATVNATTGVVTGMAAGTANIIATANDGSGVKDTCVVTVLSSVIIEGVTVLYASDDDYWSTVMGYNPGLMYQDNDNVRLTSNGAFLYYDGHHVFVDDLFHPVFNEYQWLRKAEISGIEFFYHQGETWQQAISANRLDNNSWSINDGKVIFSGDFMLVDTNREPVDPTATIDPSTVNYDLDLIMDN